MKKLQDKKPRVVIIRSNPCNPDPRVEKEARAISEIASVKILAWDREGQSPKREKLPYAEIERLRLKAPYGKIALFTRLIVWFAYVFWKAATEKYEIIHACDFDTYLPSVLPAKIRKKKIIYDIYDFYADMLNLSPTITRPIAKLDKWLIQFADHIILADKARRDQIKPSKPKKISYIYNIPEIDKGQLEKLIQTPVKDKYFFYAGLLSEDRYIKEIIELFLKEMKDYNIELAGWGPLAGFVKKASQYNKNIRFLGKIKYDQVLKKTAECKIMLAFYDPSVPNNKLASPNKLFEAMAIGKPIITNPGTSMAKFVKKQDIGFIVNPQDCKSLVKVIKKNLNKNLKRQEQKCLNLYTTKYNWEIMKQRLIRVYKTLI